MSDLTDNKDNLVQLRIAKSEQAAIVERDEETIVFLERLLEEARSGEVIGLAGIFMNPERNGDSHIRVISASIMNRSYEMIGAVRGLEVDLFKKMGE